MTEAEALAQYEPESVRRFKALLAEQDRMNKIRDLFIAMPNAERAARVEEWANVLRSS